MTTKLVGYEMVTVPAGKFLAAKILVDLEVETSGTWRGLDTTLSFDDELVYYAVAGVGIIKSSDEISFSFFLETAGSDSARIKETRQLRAYSLP